MDAAIVSALERIIADLQDPDAPPSPRRDRQLLARLKALDFGIGKPFLKLLSKCQMRSLFHFDLTALRVISRDRKLCAMLYDCTLSEHLLFVLSHDEIRCRVTARFVQETDHVSAAREEALWMGVQPLIAGLDCGLVKTPSIRSLAHYLRLVKVARIRLNSAECRLPPPPFALPEGWTWFTSGADFKNIPHHADRKSLYTAEFHYRGILRKSAYLLKDPGGDCWNLMRLPS